MEIYIKRIILIYVSYLYARLIYQAASISVDTQ
jgi:hypothetical protein